ncbi:MAG: 30S ribosomal protein S16 [Rikenellaceae bacterium]|nr:30S ribosomal protein S16 [Rikenellaceae bacterium]
MSVKIRLSRHGKKDYAFYHIVVADSRAPRDGKFIEKIGTYNPNTNPATIDLQFDKALNWLEKGAQPTDTCRAILSYKGVLYKKHLLGGVKKGAFSLEAAEDRFDKWLAGKEGQIAKKSSRLAEDARGAAKARLAEETKVKEAKALAVAAKVAAATVTEPEVIEESAEAIEVMEAAVETAEIKEESAVAEVVVVEEAAAAEEAPVAEEVPVAEETPAAQTEEKAAE